MAGRVFSIEEFSTFDGPGIRTTVFLKGCPLRCVWCHNPEGQLFERQIVKSPNNCLQCGACLDCGERLTGERKLVRESMDVCPRRLVRECGTEIEAGELCGILLKNRDLWNPSGGGITFSGGEPLSQYDFLVDCLQCTGGFASRAIQTSGYCEESRFRDILPLTDLMLFDLKIMDERRHIRYTGCSNTSILNNFQTLCESGIPVIIRMPLIPSVTDTEENMEAAAQLMHRYSKDRIELLPYNRMAGGKYALVGRHYAPGFDEGQPVEYRTELFAQYGIDVTIL